jgi:hypothetical protein
MPRLERVNKNFCGNSGTLSFSIGRKNIAPELVNKNFRPNFETLSPVFEQFRSNSGAIAKSRLEPSAITIDAIKMKQPISAETGERNGSVGDAIKRLNWHTFVLILVAGGGNLLATQQNSSQRQYQFDRVLEQIKGLYDSFDKFKERQEQRFSESSKASTIGPCCSPNRTKGLETQNVILPRLQRYVQNHKNPEAHE